MKEFYRIEKIWLADTENHGKNRIAYFSEQLDVRSLYKIFYPINFTCISVICFIPQVEVRLVCEYFSKLRPSILAKPFEDLIDILNILQNYRIFPSKTILRNFKVFTYSRDAIVERMNEMKLNSMKPRLWMVYCSRKDLDTYVTVAKPIEINHYHC